VYGGYAEVRYNDDANTALCDIENGVTNVNGGTVFKTAINRVVPGCSNNWNTWWVGTRNQWDITKSFYMGVDVLYQKLDSATPNATNTIVANSSVTGAQTVNIGGSTVPNAVAGSIKDVDNWAIRFRVHKDFLP
jgi:hypothetical protein